jgi:hypothetical protein
MLTTPYRHPLLLLLASLLIGGPRHKMHLLNMHLRAPNYLPVLAAMLSLQLHICAVFTQDRTLAKVSRERTASHPPEL